MILQRLLTDKNSIYNAAVMHIKMTIMTPPLENKNFLQKRGIVSNPLRKKILRHYIWNFSRPGKLKNTSI